MALTVSCAFATSMDTPHHVALAEDLGYERAWLYDSPALYPDVWVQLCRSAERTSRIGLGPGVLIPSLRHPMTTAAAIATLVDLAGADRVHVGVGSGFTGRFALGQKPLRWAEVRAWVECVKALLAGQTPEWEGSKIGMLHPEGFGPARPIDVPFVIGAAGPKGQAVARAVADGVIVAGGAPEAGVEWQAVLTSWTVLDEGEDTSSERVFEAAGHSAAVGYHFFAENGMGVDHLPGGAEWAAAYEAVPEDERHLAIHDLHLVGVNERDRAIVTPEVMAMMGVAWSPAELRDRLAQQEEAGITEVVYQPAGPDIERELTVYLQAARG
ncbi:MAG: LLM class flavin-dependent oxidoreductase [Actinomycetota bacterium]